MKNIYSKYNNRYEDNRPIPEPDEMLYNNSDEQQSLSFDGKVNFFVKGQKSEKTKNIEK